MQYAKVNYEITLVNGGISSKHTGTNTSTVFSEMYFIVDNKISIPSPNTIFSHEDIIWLEKDRWPYSKITSEIEVRDDANNIMEVIGYNKFTNLYDVAIVRSGSYTAKYSFVGHHEVTDAKKNKAYLTYTFSAVTNHLPLKRWTVLDVLNRTNDLIEPLSLGEKPRFRLKGVVYDDVTGRANSTLDGEEGEQARKLDKILAPEFAFTKMTAREIWQQVGGFIHGEPRITAIKKDTNGNRYFEYEYDMYGDTTMSNISKKYRVSATIGTNINEYCKALDSSAENLINQLDWAQGVVMEPFNGGSKTLRCETTTARMAEDNTTFIETNFPIYAIKKLACTYIPGRGLSYVDITPYIFEESDYGILSSYEGSYPYAKAYALYYTQGQKNIKGLFQKVPDAGSSVFQNYSIKNILEAVTGQELEDLNIVKDKSNKKYMELAFEVTYLPIYSTRVQTSKSLVVKGLPRTLAYNQGANSIESRYYGENLKGVVARLGNVDKTYTYHVAFLHEIPKTGTMFDDNYYITAVHVEYLPTYIKVTVALSKDFNRLSQYIGISSNKRMWEVSEKMVTRRNTLFKDYIVIGSEEVPDGNTLINSKAMFSIATTFSQDSERKAISAVVTWGGTWVNPTEPLTTVQLPVISSAFGNAMTFSWRYEDNYSAGQQSIENPNGSEAIGGAKGYWGAYVPYCDYYGRIYYYNFSLQTSGDSQDPFALPQVFTPLRLGEYIATKNPIVLLKDSREVLQCNYQIEFVTNRSDLIIGSALASSCPLVRGADPNIKPGLYVFNEKINKFTNHIEGKMNVDLSTFSDEDIGEITVTMLGDNKFSITGTFPADGVSWAIVTKQTTKDEPVESEDGTESTQKMYTGGDILLASNTPCKAGGTLGPIYFTAKHRLY